MINVGTATSFNRPTHFSPPRVVWLKVVNIFDVPPAVTQARKWFFSQLRGYFSALPRPELALLRRALMGPIVAERAFALHVPRRRPAAATSSFTYAQRPPRHDRARLRDAATAEQAPLYRIPPAPEAANHHECPKTPGL